MAVMIVGAVICDAGITAVLTSLISEMDTQAGTNARRVRCCKKFMSSYQMNPMTQSRILKYFEYADTELLNIDEQLLIDDLSPSLKCELLCYFCYQPLKQSPAFSDFSHGGLITLVKNMSSYVAIPGELLSTIEINSQCVYVLQRGLLARVDMTGKQTKLPVGTLVGHLVTQAEVEVHGPFTRMCFVEIDSRMKQKVGSHFITISFNGTRLCTSVKKTNRWKETLAFPIPDSLEEVIVSIKTWKKNGNDIEIGNGHIIFSDKSLETKKITLRDSQEKTIAFVKSKVIIRSLTEEEGALAQNEMSTVALGYCHLYKLTHDIVEWVKVSCSKNDHSSNILSPSHLISNSHKRGFQYESFKVSSNETIPFENLNGSGDLMVETNGSQKVLEPKAKWRSSHGNRVLPITNTGINEKYDKESNNDRVDNRITFVSEWREIDRLD